MARREYRQLQEDVKLEVLREPSYGLAFMNCVFRVIEFYGPLEVSCCLNWNWRIVTAC